MMNELNRGWELSTGHDQFNRICLLIMGPS
jgi:hypothetical protein